MIFNEVYNRERFSEFLRNFLPEDFVEREKDLSHIDSCKVINQAYELGTSTSLGVHVLEMSHKKDTDPRVAIATDAFRILATYQIDKALVIFKSENSDNYRFSLLTISLDVNEKNKLVKTYSNARRFSFYLGPGAKVRTPEHQLVTKGRMKDVTDLVDRFSLEVVNKQFYLELVKHFDALVDEEKKILSLPYQSDPNVRKSFAMRLIGRIMFCWFLKQKHSPTDGPLIPDALLSSKSVKDGYYHGILEPLFFGILNTPMEGRDIRGDIYDSVPYLNGGLFNPQHDDYYDLDREILVSKHINTLVISDEWFRNFFSLLETYNFTIDENMVFDQELSVDPEMLGRIFENLLAEINPETGSSERKRTGSYYTPRQIVEYMVDRSLIEHLKTKTGISEKKLEALVSYDLNDDSENPLTLPERKLVIDAIDSLRLLDPACGSGAFPIGALQKIVWILQRVDADCELWLEKKLAKVPELYKQKIRKDATTNPFDYTRKLDVIKNSIFGVDIQPIAVEIARLRCFLTLVVESEVNDTKPNRGVDPLPNLDFKFVCANTLIPAPEESSEGQRLFTDDFEEKLSAAVDRYFSSFGASKSSAGNDIHRLIDSKVDEQLRYVQNLISHSDERYQAVLAKTHKKSIDTHTHVLTLWASYKNLFENKPVGFFDPKYFFPSVKDGFDIVIANPPYIDSEGMINSGHSNLRDLIQTSYRWTKGNWDIYIAFFELGFKHLSKYGVLTYITPDKWISKPFGAELRRELMEHFISVIRSGRAVFDSAKVDSIITVISKNTMPDLQVLEYDGKNINLLRTVTKSRIRTPFSLDNLFSDNLQLIEKLSDFPNKFADIALCENACATSDAYTLKSIIQELESNKVCGEDYFKVINTGTIGKYHSRWGEKDMVYLKGKYKHPVVSRSEFLSTFPNSYGKKALKKKIIIKGLNLLDACLDEDGCIIPGKTTLIIPSDDIENLKILLGLVNSKLLLFYIKEKYPASSYNQGTTFTKDMLNELPLPKLDNVEKTKLTNLVTSIITNKNSDTSSADLENQVDQLVYKLYNITPDEIKIIEN